VVLAAAGVVPDLEEEDVSFSLPLPQSLSQGAREEFSSPSPSGRGVGERGKPTG